MVDRTTRIQPSAAQLVLIELAKIEEALRHIREAVAADEEVTVDE